ncbi:ZNF503 [Cordylochernes scorpioides]|uniref:ZNF503 n=1 Tax=Cordylochernes scorpioides TaxID=51811 RepID=A0ABY6LS54_9ARAC|nr:ZNF503 [Cordylochernes scorpioides]
MGFVLLQLDAKKSPLALLAQTCSNIGADNPNNKPIIPPLEKPKDNDKKDKSCEEKSSFKPYESTKKEEKIIPDNERKTPNCKNSTSPSTRTNSPNSTTGSCGKSSPGDAKSDSTNASTTTTSTSSTSQSTLSGLGYASSALGLDLARADSALAKDGLATMAHLGLGAYKSSLSPMVSCTGCAPGHIPVDAASTAHSYPPGIATQSGISPLKPGFSPLSPYVGFARVKTAGGGTTLVPVCRDPYCTNCSLSVQSAQLTSCPGGCTQCTHDRLGNSFGTSPGLPSFVPSLPGSTSPAGGAGLTYPPSMLSRTHVCSWVMGDSFCGKRFTTGDDLLQHLRTHTNHSGGGAADSASLSLFPPSISVPGSVSSLSAACHLYYSSAPSASLRRSYPTSLSPVSSLTAAAARYHPYKAPIPTTPLPPIPHPGLGMYYAPYSIYGQSDITYFVIYEEYVDIVFRRRGDDDGMVLETNCTQASMFLEEYSVKNASTYDWNTFSFTDTHTLDEQRDNSIRIKMVRTEETTTHQIPFAKSAVMPNSYFNFDFFKCLLKKKHQGKNTEANIPSLVPKPKA